MAIYDGVVTVAEDDIPVIIELDGEHVRLSASGTEIGQWRAEDCHISHVSDTTYTISAEDEVLSFVPNQPSLFAAAINGSNGSEPSKATPPAGVESEQPDEMSAPETVQEQQGGHQVREAPMPKASTMGLFYALCVLTVGLAIWSLISIVF